MPSKPAPFDLQGVTTNDLADFTPEIKAEALKIAAQYKLGPIFTPPIVYDSDGKQGTLQVPGAGGGANWQGAAVDPETGMLYVPSNTTPYLSALVHDPKRSDMNYIARGGVGGIGEPLGLPLLKPPYGRITAIDLNTGDHAWMVPNGETPDDVKNNPALKGIDTSKFGGPNKAPLLVTKTLLFAGGGTRFRALEKKTGAVVFDMKLAANDTGGPMTYLLNGRQFIVVALTSRDSGPELIALALPRSDGDTKARPAPAPEQ